MSLAEPMLPTAFGTCIVVRVLTGSVGLYADLDLARFGDRDIASLGSHVLHET